MISNKQDFLKFIKGAGVGLYGAATANQTVKFAYTENIAKVGTAADGTITFYADKTNKTGIITVGGDVVSSKILNVTSTAVNNGKTGENTITVTFFNATTKTADTITFDVVNAAAAKVYFEDYFTNSNTIAITGGTADVKVDGQTILIDSTNGLKSGLKLVYVPASAASGDNPAVDAHIALSDNSNTELYTIPVASIVGNGVLDHSSYDKQKNELHLFFKTAQAGVFNEVVIPVGEILDINDIFINNDSSIYLTATPDTSVMNLGVLTVDPSTAAADNTGLADAWEVKKYVDSKSTTLAVEAEGDNYVNASVDANNNKKINVAATDKTKTAVALAETAVQSVVEGTSVEGYVALNVSAKDASVVTITTDDSSLSAKITAIDNKDSEQDSSITTLKAKDVEIDGSINAIKTEIGSSTGGDESGIYKYVQDEISELSVSAAGDNLVSAAVDAENKKKINVSATSDLTTAVANANSAVQSGAVGTNATNYVTNTKNASTLTVEFAAEVLDASTDFGNSIDAHAFATAQAIKDYVDNQMTTGLSWTVLE